jgi:hypothetical protein
VVLLKIPPVCEERRDARNLKTIFTTFDGETLSDSPSSTLLTEHREKIKLNSNFSNVHLK